MNTEIINKYNNLSDIEKTMVQILGVSVCALRQNDLLEILNMSGLYDTNGKTLNIQKFRLLLNGLINKNLVEKQAAGVSCNEFLIDFAFKEALDCGKFSEISDLILEKSPLEKADSGFYDFSSYKECIKAIQAGFSEKKDEIYFEAVYLSANEKFSSMPFFYNFFVKQFQKKLLDKLSSKKRAVVIKNIFYDCLLFLLPPFSLIDYLKELLSIDPDFEYKYFFLENFLLWGRFADAESLVEINGECSSFELCRFFAIYYSFKGDCEKAVLFFKKSLDFLEKKRWY